MNGVLFLVLGAVLLAGAYMTDDVAGYRESNIVWKNQINEYSNYVHFQPEWASYPRNLIVDVSTSWERQITQDEEKPDMTKHGAKNKQNGLVYVNGKPVVAVQYDYRDCQSQWFHYAKTGLDFLGNHFALFEKESIPNTSYSDQAQEQKLSDGFAQFIPICTSRENTSYKYTIDINDDSLGFDVYFVPSYIQQWYYFLHPEYFEYYEQDGCYANNHLKFTGSCDVGKNAGLLIIIPDDLSRPMTKISVSLIEQ
ncbi:MAG: hypothetical protein OXC46_01965 [Thaumarchaeota archaeon]|nr:hypothetical protein [Nitrososphaerota archaeon]